MILMMNLDDEEVDENGVKEQILGLVEKVVEELDLFMEQAENVPMGDIKKLQRVSKKLKKEFSL